MNARICNTVGDIEVFDGLSLPGVLRSVADSAERRDREENEDTLIALSPSYHYESGWSIVAVWEHDLEARAFTGDDDE